MRIANFLAAGAAAVMLAALPSTAQEKPEVRLGYEQRNPKPVAPVAPNMQGSSPYRSASQLPIAQPGYVPPAYIPGVPNAGYPFPYGFSGQGGFYGYSGRGFYSVSGIVTWPSGPSQANELKFNEESVEREVESWADDIEAHAGLGVYSRSVYLHDIGEPVDFLFYKRNGNIQTNIFAIIVVDKIGQELKGVYPKKKLDKVAIDRMHQSLEQQGVPLYVLEAKHLNPERLREALAYFSSLVMPHVVVRKHEPYVYEITDEGPERGSQKRLIKP